MSETLPILFPSDVRRCPTNADDRQAILDLISSYSYAYDASDLERFAALFQANAVVTFRQGNLTGNAHIREAMAARRRWVAQQGIQPRHYQTNTLLTEIAEGHVKGRTMILVTPASTTMNSEGPLRDGSSQSAPSSSIRRASERNLLALYLHSIRWNASAIFMPASLPTSSRRCRSLLRSSADG